MIKAAEVEAKLGVWAGITAEAQRLSVQFSEAEFISKVSGGGAGGRQRCGAGPTPPNPAHTPRALAQCIPDPLETGVIDAMRKVIMPAAQLFSQGK